MNYYVSGEIYRGGITFNFGLKIKQSNQFMAAVEAVYEIKDVFGPTEIKILDVYVLEEEDD